MKTEAQKRAQKKYQNKARAEGKQAQLNVTVTPEEKTLIDKAAADAGLSRPRLLVAAVKYCVDNGVILSDKPELDK